MPPVNTAVCQVGLVGGAQSVTTILEDLKISLNCVGDATCTVFDMFEGGVCGWRLRGEVGRLIICNGGACLLW